MKKVILLCAIMLCLTACAGTEKQVENPDTLRAALLCAPDSVTAKNAMSQLEGSTLATLTAEKIDASEAVDYSDYDVIYVDKSVKELPYFDSNALQFYVQNGGSVFLDNETYDLFTRDFIGAEDYVHIEGCPVDMEYNPSIDESLKKIQSLIWDFTSLYPEYADYYALAEMDYGVGIIPTTAQCITTRAGLGIFTINDYGEGKVFFTNPILPNNFSVNNLSPEDTGEPLAASTIGANKLIKDYFAEMVSLKKYGYAVERVFGSYARPSASWELHYEDITGIEHGSAEIFEDMCKAYGQVPSFTLVRNPYIWFRRAESVTYSLGEGGQYSMDAYENAYSSGTHFVSAKNWLTLDYYDDTISYFEESHDYTKRAYPYPVDFNHDGNMDLICGSADGGIYFFEGNGMKTNYEFAYESVFTDADGNPISVGAYSSPCLADIDRDGEDEMIAGSENGEIRYYECRGGMVLEDMGVLIDTGLTDAMPSAGDLNGDGITDIAVGSRSGELRIYYGDQGLYGAVYSGYENIDAVTDWCAPCIADRDGDGRNELYAGTFNGYIETFDRNILSGYLEGTECNYKGNTNLKFGTNCVPRFYDINGDGEMDLIAGSLEYGMAIPADSEYFPYREKLQEQLDGFKERGIYVGVHSLSHYHADPFHDERELEYQKRAFKSYGIPFEGAGANQHTWRTSEVGYDTHYDNPQGYDGTYKKQFEAGLLWNSGSQLPASAAVPEVSAENSILIPFYLDNGLLMLQPSNTPSGSTYYSSITAKYEAPLLFYNHCDYVYSDMENEEMKIRKADRIVNDYGYSFVMENQLAKMTAAAYNTRVNAKMENGELKMSAETIDKTLPLYDERYAKAVGVKIIFAEGAADEYSVDAEVSYKKDNNIYTSLHGGSAISKNGESNDIMITALNVPADISKNNNGATVKFLDGGMMTVTVKGNAKTTSDGWDVTQQNGETTFRKYGKAETLKISR